MNDTQFDRLTRLLAKGSRRRAAKMLGGSALSILFPPLGTLTGTPGRGDAHAGTRRSDRVETRLLGRTAGLPTMAQFSCSDCLDLCQTAVVAAEAGGAGGCEEAFRRSRYCGGGPARIICTVGAAAMCAALVAESSGVVPSCRSICEGFIELPLVGAPCDADSEEPPPPAPTSPPPSTPAGEPLRAERTFGPQDGSLTMKDDNNIEHLYAGVDVRDFIVEARFYNPYDADRAGRGWDYGFLFRHTGSNQQYRLSVDSSQRWSLVLRDEGESDEVASGSTDRLDTSSGGVNDLRLIVVGEVAFFLVNGTYVAGVSVSDKMAGGDVALATNMYNGNAVDGGRVYFEGLAVWDIRPHALPQGELRHDEADGYITTLSAGVDVRDFIVEARFYNPYDADRAGRGWDYGFIVRDTGSNRLFWISVGSTGGWNLTLRDGEGDGMTTTVLADGVYDGLRLDPEDSNRLMLMMDGNSAVFALNGDHIGILDVSAIPESGAVKIGTGFWRGDELTGSSTSYQNFTIWPLDR